MSIRITARAGASNGSRPSLFHSTNAHQVLYLVARKAVTHGSDHSSDGFLFFLPRPIPYPSHINGSHRYSIKPSNNPFCSCDCHIDPLLDSATRKESRPLSTGKHFGVSFAHSLLCRITLATPTKKASPFENSSRPRPSLSVPMPVNSTDGPWLVQAKRGTCQISRYLHDTCPSVPLTPSTSLLAFHHPSPIPRSFLPVLSIRADLYHRPIFPLARDMKIIGRELHHRAHTHTHAHTHKQANREGKKKKNK